MSKSRENKGKIICKTATTTKKNCANQIAEGIENQPAWTYPNTVALHSKTQ